MRLRIFRVIPSSESAAPAAVVVLYPVCVSVTASSEHSACAAGGGRKHHLALCVCVCVVYIEMLALRMSATCFSNSPERSAPLTPTNPGRAAPRLFVYQPSFVLENRDLTSFACVCE